MVRYLAHKDYDMAGFILPLIALAVAVGLATPNMAQADFTLPATRTQTFPNVTNITLQSRVILPAQVQEAYDQEFAIESFFGAFAISKDFGYGYSTGAHTLEAARALAMAFCLELNSECRIIAELTPASYQGPQTGVITLSTEAAGYFNSRQDYATYRAMAASAAGSYALVWSAPTQSEANRIALSDCEGYRESEPPGLRDMPCILVPGF